MFAFLGGFMLGAIIAVVALLAFIVHAWKR